MAFSPGVDVDQLFGDGARDRFARDGYLTSTGPILTADELAEARSLVEDVLGRAQTNDLGVGGPDGGRIVEVNSATEVERALTRTAAFRRCRALSAALLGVPVAPFFDHVIAKPPRNLSATPWHQDTAYAEPDHVFPPTAHLWLALQDATVDNGCMQFVPGSHRSRLPHRKRGGDAAATALEAVDPDVRGAVACPIPAGGLTVHHPGILHGTGPNDTDGWRLAWILQFREAGTWGARSRIPRPLLRARERLRRR